MTSPKSLLDHFMLNDLSSLHWGLGHVQTAEELELVHQVLVHLDIEEHGTATTVLREDDGALGRVDLCEHGRCAGTKLGDRPDVC